MKSDYKTFKFTLRTMAPVHIGSGEKYTSREFIYENDSFYFPDMGKFYASMVAKGLDRKFEAFLMEHGKRAVNNRLVSFTYDNRIKDRNFGGYKIKESDYENDKSSLGTLNEISKIVRDGFGQPYIPGSSLKGAIRTILLNSHPEWKEANFATGRKGKEKEDKTVVPWGAKPGKDFDDLFNEIRVSDSQSLKINGIDFKNEDIILVQKLDKSSKESGDKLRALPLYREALPPFTVAEFTITTTTERAASMMRSLGQLSFDFYKSYKEFFLNDFSEKYIQDNVQYPIYLGAGSGAWTKTIFKQANGILQKRYDRVKTKMIGKGVLKLTRAKNKSFLVKGQERKLVKNNENLYEMGKANFIIQEVKV